MRSRHLVPLLACALLCAWPAGAQEQRGSIEGLIKDSSGAVVPGVSVEARSDTPAAAWPTGGRDGRSSTRAS